jgi:1-acyl-sn-glycerol-3-phosphate acyltransferase
MDSWSYQPTEDFDKGPIERLKSFPRHPDLLIYTLRLFTNLVMRAALKIWHRLEIVGELPHEGSFVIVANHSSHLDAAAILSAVPLKKVHRAFPAAAADYFFTNLPALAFSAIVVNAMPFDRKENPRQSLALCRQLLDAPGHILILFPEGTRTVDGSLGRFKPGIGFLIAGTEFPVVPCYLEGAYRAWPKGKWIPRPRKLRLIIGEPLTFRDRTPVKEDAVAIADALREKVTALAAVAR